MDKNQYLELLLKDFDSKKQVNPDSIGLLLSHVTDLHNTIGKSYEYLVDVISGLANSVNAAKEKKQEEAASKKLEEAANLKKAKEFENQIVELRAKIIVLEQELDRYRDKTHQMEIESMKKDEALVELKNKLDKMSEKALSTALPSKTSSVIKASAGKKLEDLISTPSPPTDFSYLRNEPEKTALKEETKGPVLLQDPPQLKRKYNELNKPEPALLGIGEENENSRSSTTSYNRKDEIDNFDDLKFKKMFKKVKRNENSKENNNNSHNTGSNPMHSLFNEMKNENKKTEIMSNKPARLTSFDADNSLQNLLNNFLDVKENSSSTVFNKKKSTFNTDEPKIVIENQQLLPASLSADEAFEIEHNAKVYKKGFDMVNFSQKSPLKSLDITVEPLHSQVVPITRNGRVGGAKSETAMNLMQRMLNSNKKRNSYDMNGMFKMSAKANTKEYPEITKGALNKINDEDLVRTAYRTKAEREDLQGFDCDQCKQFYEYFADGIHIKSAAEQCDRCSRHKGKFPLPSTPEIFHNNFSLNSQD